ncbi:GNAT family N-acetyltransferase [Hoeflea sp. AS60]|uniref:GNAT family N-acetyltransferase n=1 Tax=Hoeflea sp. AS60 TaxID=3135780 RepID=UPI003181F604
MSNTDSEISLVKLDDRHLEGALKLSQEFNWPYRLEDWAFAAQVGEGFVLERDRVVLGTALWWCYGEHYASAGMIIVTSNAQGGGNGSRLFNALLDATKGRAVLLNSTEEGLPLYRRRGFEPWGMVLQQQGILETPPKFASFDTVQPAVIADLEAILRIDERAIGMPRQRLIAALTAIGDCVVIRRDGAITGFSILRRFGRGYVVGPVAAENLDDAKCLICAHLAKLGGQFVRIDVYAQDGLSDWLQSLGLISVGEAVSMVNRKRPNAAGPAHMFAVSNQSFS